VKEDKRVKGQEIKRLEAGKREEKRNVALIKKAKIAVMPRKGKGTGSKGTLPRFLRLPL